MTLRPFVRGLLILALPTTLVAAPAIPTGLYTGTLLNAHPLPRVERVPSEDGWEHWFKLEAANITLRPDGKFIASFKYYRQHVPPRAPVRPGPLLNETYKGKFSVKGTRSHEAEAQASANRRDDQRRPHEHPLYSSGRPKQTSAAPRHEENRKLVTHFG